MDKINHIVTCYMPDGSQMSFPCASLDRKEIFFWVVEKTNLLRAYKDTCYFTIKNLRDKKIYKYFIK